MRILSFLLIMLLAGCSVSPQQSEKTTIEDGALVRLTDSDARGLDPQILSDLSSTRIAADQFEGLTRFNAHGAPEAGLAESWQIRADGLIWTFQLRPNLRFSDGTAIKPEVFAKALARIRDDKSGSPHKALFDAIEVLSVTGPSSLTIRLKNPFPELPALLAHPAMAALPFHRIDAVGDKWTSDRPMVTSGAYRLTQWKLAQQLQLEASPTWHGGRPVTDKIIWRPIDNMNSAMRLVLSGGAHIGSDYPPGRHHWLKRNYPKLVRSSPYLGTYYFAFNTRRAPFNDVRVRRALSMAIDRQWMAEKMVNAGNEPAWGLIPPALQLGGKAYRPAWASWPQEKRMKAARALLKEAGYGPARPLRFEIRFNSSSEHRRAAVAMATMWRDLGVEAILLNSESSLHFDSLKRADFDLARSGWIADLPTAENFLSVHRSNAGAQNYSGFNNDAFDQALDAALLEADDKKRKEMMQMAEKIVIDEQPILPLYFYTTRALVQTNVTGWHDNSAHIHPSRTLGIR